MIDNLSTAELVALYNRFADKPVKKFETKQIAFARVHKLLTEKRIDENGNSLDQPAAPSTTLAAAFPPPGYGVNAKGEFVPMPGYSGSVFQAAVEESRKKASIAPAKKSSKKSVKAEVGPVGLTGKKLALLRLLQRPEGLSEPEGCKELNWAACGATITRVMTAAASAGLMTRKEKGEDKRTRYYVSVSA